MVQLVLIGISAGAAAALLFASVASGAILSVLLFYLAPLPILIAAIGWSHWAALIAAVVAAISLAAAFGGYFLVAFLFGIGLPAWWLGYLALLARPSAGRDGLEWYPVGHLVFWSAMLGALIVIVAMLSIGTDVEGFRAALRRGLERVFSAQARAPTGSAAPSRLIDFLVNALPPAAAVLTTLTNVVNLWLASRIVKISGRLRRPEPDLPALSLPPYAPALAAIAIAGSFMPGMIGIGAGVLAASTLMAYAILGFAVLHAITRGMGGRPFVLAGVYVAVVVFGWPVLLMTLLGLIDAALDLRGRIGRRTRPPDGGT